MTVPKLELKNVEKFYGENVVAVDGISLQVDSGETLALLGPSGCGKSTTLNMVVGLETPTRGEILIDGKSVEGLSPGQRNVGLVFQDYAVFTHMNVEQNLAFGLQVRKVGKTEVTKKVHETAEFLGLTKLLKEKASRLGGSELQRVAIGRTLVTKPSILLLDEPLSNLESEARTAMRQELRRLQAETNLTIIYVTHDQIEALSLADNVAVMNAGKICEFGPTESVYDRPGHVFVAEFIGEPPMNIVYGEIKESGDALIFKRDNFILKLNNLWPSISTGPIQLGIRPELIEFVDIDDQDFSGEITLVQPRGPDTLITLEVGEFEIQALFNSEEVLNIGDQVGIRLPNESIAFFDNDSGMNILN